MLDVSVSLYWKVFCTRPCGMMSDSPNWSNPVMITRGTFFVDCGKKFGFDRPNANRASFTMRAPSTRVQPRLKFCGLFWDEAPYPLIFELMKVFPSEFCLLFCMA